MSELRILCRNVLLRHINPPETSEADTTTRFQAHRKFKVGVPGATRLVTKGPRRPLRHGPALLPGSESSPSASGGQEPAGRTPAARRPLWEGG